MSAPEAVTDAAISIAIIAAVVASTASASATSTCCRRVCSGSRSRRELPLLALQRASRFHEFVVVAFRSLAQLLDIFGQCWLFHSAALYFGSDICHALLGAFRDARFDGAK